MELAQESMRTVDPVVKAPGGDQGGHVNRLPFLNRHRLCGRQKGWGFRSQADGARGF
jgi:hypothetical protein